MCHALHRLSGGPVCRCSSTPVGVTIGPVCVRAMARVCSEAAAADVGHQAAGIVQAQAGLVQAALDIFFICHGACLCPVWRAAVGRPGGSFILWNGIYRDDLFSHVCVHSSLNHKQHTGARPWAKEFVERKGIKQIWRYGTRRYLIILQMLLS